MGGGQTLIALEMGKSSNLELVLISPPAYPTPHTPPPPDTHTLFHARTWPFPLRAPFLFR